MRKTNLIFIMILVLFSCNKKAVDKNDMEDDSMQEITSTFELEKAGNYHIPILLQIEDPTNNTWFLNNKEKIKSVRGKTIDYNFSKKGNVVELPYEEVKYQNSKVISYSSGNLDSNSSDNYVFNYDENDFINEYFVNGDILVCEKNIVENKINIIIENNNKNQVNKYLITAHTDYIEVSIEVFTDGEKEDISQVYYVYDQENRLRNIYNISRYKWKYKKWNDICFVYSYEYDDNGNIVLIKENRTEQIYSYTNPTEEFKIIEDDYLLYIERDFSEGRIDEQRNYLNGLDKLPIITKYKDFDDFNNWWLAEFYDEEGLAVEIVREIEYE